MIQKLEDIKRLLWEQWDPIGVLGLDGADGEYDGYALEIWTRLKRGVSARELAEYLTWAELEHMALDELSGRAEDIASKAIAIGG